MFGIKKEDFVSFWGKGLMFGIKKRDFCDFLGNGKVFGLSVWGKV